MHFICSNMTWIKRFFSPQKFYCIEHYSSIDKRKREPCLESVLEADLRVPEAEKERSHSEESLAGSVARWYFWFCSILYFGAFYTCSLYSKLFIFHSHVNLSLRLFECYLHLSVDTYGNRYIYFGR